MQRSIQEAEETLLIAARLVVIIIFVFLRNLRATIIPGLAIPTSIVATFAIMYFLGFSINNFTLLALTLAIGIVVDDAIIVLENAYRHQEELGESPEAAATNGTREIGFAVLATTIALVAVFTPLAFLKGSTGRLFNEFGIAVAGSVIISGFVALTLTPMLCAKILRVPQRHGVLYRALESGLQQPGGRVRPRAPAARCATGWAVVGVAVAVTRRRGGRLPRPQAGVRAAGGQGLVLQLHHRARGIVAGLHRRLPAAGRGDPGQDQGRRELLQRGEHRRRGEPRDHLHQPGGLVHSAPGRCRTSSARCSPSSSASRACSPSPTIRRRSASGSPVNFVIQHPDFDSAGSAATTRCWPGRARSRGCSTWTATSGSTSRS